MTRRRLHPFALPLLASVLAMPLAARAGIDCVDTTEWKAIAEATRDRLTPPSRLMGPPPDPQVGDTWDWYIWDLAGAPVGALEPCTVRGEGPNVYIVVRDADWNVFVTQADVDAVLEHAETRSYGLDPTRGFVPLDIEAFGDPPLGLDGDPKMYLLYYDFTIASDGFVGWADPYPDQGTGFNKSNECEVLYLNCGPDPGLDHSPSGQYMLAVAAHELEHVIHRGYDEDEENWLDESLAEIGMYLFDPTAEFIASFLADPDVSITLSNPEGSYGARYFFGTHLFEEYGGAATTRDLVAEPLNAIPGVDRVLGDHGFAGGFRQLFDSWVVANWLDDPRISVGEYGYDDFDYPPFQAFASHSVFPLASASGSVSRWAADYARFTDFAPLGLTVSIQGTPGNTLSVRLLAVDSAGVELPLVLPVVLDAGGAGSASVPANSGHDTAVLVVTAVEPTADPASYTYAAETAAPIELLVTKDGPGLNRTAVLDWTTPAPPPFYVHRSANPETIASDPEMTWPIVTYTKTDPNVLGPLHFYIVEQP